MSFLRLAITVFGCLKNLLAILLGLFFSSILCANEFEVGDEVLIRHSGMRSATVLEFSPEGQVKTTATGPRWINPSRLKPLESTDAYYGSDGQTFRMGERALYRFEGRMRGSEIVDITVDGWVQTLASGSRYFRGSRLRKLNNLQSYTFGPNTFEIGETVTYISDVHILEEGAPVWFSWEEAQVTEIAEGGWVKTSKTGTRFLRAVRIYKLF